MIYDWQMMLEKQSAGAPPACSNAKIFNSQASRLRSV